MKFATQEISFGQILALPPHSKPPRKKKNPFYVQLLIGKEISLGDPAVIGSDSTRGAGTAHGQG